MRRSSRKVRNFSSWGGCEVPHRVPWPGKIHCQDGRCSLPLEDIVRRLVEDGADEACAGAHIGRDCERDKMDELAQGRGQADDAARWEAGARLAAAYAHGRMLGEKGVSLRLLGTKALRVGVLLIVGFTPGALLMLPAQATAVAADTSAPAGSGHSGASGPILSGYGSSGANVQVLLGAALASGHGTSGGTGGSGSTATTATTVSTSTASASAGSGTAGTGTSGGAGAGGSGTAATNGSEATGATQGASSTLAGHAIVGTQPAIVAAQPLGLSGGDLVAVLVVALALVPIGLLTRSVARGNR